MKFVVDGEGVTRVAPSPRLLWTNRRDGMSPVFWSARMRPIPTTFYGLLGSLFQLLSCYFVETRHASSLQIIPRVC